MIKPLIYELLHGNWLMHEPSIPVYTGMLQQLLAGKEIPTGFFGSLTLPDAPDHVALVCLNGALTKSDVCESQGTRSISLEIEKAAADPKIKGIVVLSENCPGGNVDGTEELAKAIRAANNIKPVIGAVDGLCASAGVWALTQCEEIFATNETDFIGCIGVMTRIKNPKSTSDERFVEVVSDFSPEKNAEYKDENKLKNQVLNPLAILFQKAVKNGRGERLNLENENILSGKTYLAADAHKFGLIDGIMPYSKIFSRINFLHNKRKTK